MTAASISRDDDLVSPSLKLSMARDKQAGQIALSWGIGLGALLIILFNTAEAFTLFRQMLPSPTLTLSTGQGHLSLALFTVIAGGAALALTRFQRRVFFSVMAVATVLVLGLTVMGLRQGWAISGSTIAVRPAEFWKADTVFGTQNIMSLRRGCNVSQGRGEVQFTPMFDVSYTVGGRTGDWAANRVFTNRDATNQAAKFVDGLAGLRLKPGIPTERVGSSVFADRSFSAAELAANGNFNQCVGFFTRMLDPERAAEFRQIVGADQGRNVIG